MSKTENEVCPENLGQANKRTKSGKSINLEIAFILFLTGQSLQNLIYINSIELLYCRYKWDLDSTICFNDTLPFIVEVQKFTTTFQFLTSCFSTGVPAILLFFMGPWSDTHGRKPLLMLTTLGFFVNFALWTWASTTVHVNPMWFVIFSVPFLFTGGLNIFLFAGSCYICDLTTEKSRSFRLGRFQASIHIGSVLGSIISIYANKIGYTMAFALATLLSFVSLAIFTMIEESGSQRDADSVSNKELVSGQGPNIFSWHHLQDIIHFYKKRSTKTRLIILLSVIVRFLYASAHFGVTSILFVYLQWELRFTFMDYTVYNCFAMVTDAIFAILGIYILTKIFKLSDIHLLCLIALLEMLSEVPYLLHPQKALIYISSMIGSFGNSFGTFQKSFLSKIIGTDDIGKVLCLLDFGEAFSAFCGALIYSALYQFTFTNFPAAPFFLSTSIHGCIFVIMAILAKLMKEPLTWEKEDISKSEDFSEPVPQKPENKSKVSNIFKPDA